MIAEDTQSLRARVQNAGISTRAAIQEKDEMKQQLEASQQLAQTASKERESIATQLAEIRGQLAANQSSAQTAAKERETFEDQLLHSRNISSKATASLQQAKGELDKTRSELVSLQADLEKATSDKLSLHHTNLELETELHNLKNQMATQLQETQKLKAYIQTAATERETFEDHLLHSRNISSKATASLQQAKGELDKTNSELVSLQADLDKANSAKLSLHLKIRELEAELQTLKMAPPGHLPAGHHSPQRSPAATLPSPPQSPLPVSPNQSPLPVSSGSEQPQQAHVFRAGRIRMSPSSSSETDVSEASPPPSKSAQPSHFDPAASRAFLAAAASAAMPKRPELELPERRYPVREGRNTPGPAFYDGTAHLHRPPQQRPPPLMPSPTPHQPPKQKRSSMREHTPSKADAPAGEPPRGTSRPRTDRTASAGPSASPIRPEPEVAASPIRPVDQAEVDTQMREDPQANIETQLVDSPVRPLSEPMQMGGSPEQPASQPMPMGQSPEHSPRRIDLSAVVVGGVEQGVHAELDEMLQQGPQGGELGGPAEVPDGESGYDTEEGEEGEEGGPPEDSAGPRLGVSLPSLPPVVEEAEGLQLWLASKTYPGHPNPRNGGRA